MVHDVLREVERNFTTSGPGALWELVDTELSAHLVNASSMVHSDLQHFCMPGVPDVWTDVWAAMLESGESGPRMAGGRD